MKLQIRNIVIQYTEKHERYFDRDSTGNRFIEAFQLFKILINNVDNLIIDMPLTEEVLRTQFYDTVDTYETLYYTKHSYRQDECKETHNNVYNIFFAFETITSEKTHTPYLCWIYNEDIQQ